ncbi:MAG: sugar transporter substrate-binding protein [Microbacteriaceae bacterium]|jgi:protein TorT|nr:sugar transporter substrate-binding protein [Microbacteriaceae bacterium]HEV7957406.1 TMAO reductase system periplasmic protein TorT [Marisediminicola sp.]
MRTKHLAILVAAVSIYSLTACSGSSGTAAEAELVADLSVDATFIDCDAADVEPAGCIGAGTEGTYTSLAANEVTQPWELCSTVPHLKDPLWIAYNYGQTIEAQRLGVGITLTDVGGYENVTEQVTQIEDCVTQGADAILVGAVSEDALNPAIEAAEASGVLVLDVGNGVTTPEVSGHAIVDYYDMGAVVGKYLADSGEALKVSVLPGPAGAGWAERSLLGIQDAIADSDVEIVDLKYGDTGREVQLQLVEDTLAANPDIDAIIGTAVTLDVAATVLAERGLTESIALYGTYIIPSTMGLIEAGTATCAPTEQPVMTSRIAVDMAVRLLEGKTIEHNAERVGPQPLLVCGPSAGDDDNLDTFDSTTSFAVDDWAVASRIDATVEN